MSYSEQLQEVTQRIETNEALLPDRQRRIQQLEYQGQQLRQQLAQLDEQQEQAENELEEIQIELDVLCWMKTICEKLVLVQKSHDRGLRWRFQELGEAELSISSMLEENDIPTLVRLRTHVRDDMLNVALDLAKKQETNNQIGRAIKTLEQAKSRCDQAEESVLKRIRRRLATVLEDRAGRSNDLGDYWYAAEEWGAVQEPRCKERVLGKIARLYEGQSEFREAIRTHYERLLLLESEEKKTTDIKTCLENIYRLGSRLGEASPDEKEAYEWAISYYSNRKIIDGLEWVDGFADKRNLTEIRDKARRFKFETLMAPSEVAVDVSVTSDKIERKRELLSKYKRNLHSVEMQIASHGGEMSAPLHLLNQRDEIRTKIERLEA